MLDGTIKCAVLLRHAPPEVRAALRASAHATGDDYQQVRDQMLVFLRTGLDYMIAGSRAQGAWEERPVPMEIGALHHKGKGKKGGKAHWEKGAAKGK